jgi:hypothetical protein
MYGFSDSISVLARGVYVVVVFIVVLTEITEPIKPLVLKVSNIFTGAELLVVFVCANTSADSWEVSIAKFKAKASAAATTIDIVFLSMI